MRAIGFDSKRDPHINLLFSGRGSALELSTQNGSGNQIFSVAMKIGNRTCSSEKSLVSDSAGVGRLFGKLSGPKRREIPLTFSVKQNNTVVTSTVVTLYNSKGRRNITPISLKDTQALCKQFTKFR